MKKKKLLLLSVSSLLSFGVVATLASQGSNDFLHQYSVSAQDQEVGLTLSSANSVTTDGTHNYDGVSAGATGAISFTYTGVNSESSDNHVVLNNGGTLSMPVNRATKVIISANGSFVIEYGERSDLLGGKESFTLVGTSETINLPAEVNFVKISATSSLAISSLQIRYISNGNCTEKADNTYESGLLNSSDVYYGNEKVTFDAKEYSHKVVLSDSTRLELTLSKEGEEDIVRYFMFVSQTADSVRFEDSQGNYATLTGNSLLTKTAVISLNGQQMNGSYAKLQKLSSFTLDDYGSYTIAVGEEYEIHATSFNPSNATFKDVVWESSDSSVASVVGSGENNATGTVSIDGVGSSTISAYVISDPNQGTKVTANRTVTFDAVASIALPSTFYGDNWANNFSSPDFELAIDEDDIFLEDNLNGNSGVVLHVSYKSGSTYYLADDYGLYLLGASYSSNQIHIAQNYVVNGVRSQGTGTITFSKPEPISSVKATIGNKEYKTAETAYPMIAGDTSGYITFTRTGGNHFTDNGVQVVITEDPLEGTPEPTPEEATLPGTWTGEGYTVVVSNDEQSFVINGGEFDSLEATYDGDYYYVDENYEYYFSFDAISGGTVVLHEIGSLYIDINLSKEGYTPVEPRKDVFEYSNGTIKANREGKGYVAYSWTDLTDDSIKTAYLYVDISERVVAESVALSTDKANDTVNTGAIITVSANITASNPSKPINKSNVSWTIEEGTTKLSKKSGSTDTSCQFEGKAAGTAVVRWRDSISGVTDTITITVSAEESYSFPWDDISDGEYCDNYFGSVNATVNSSTETIVFEGYGFEAYEEIYFEYHYVSSNSKTEHVFEDEDGNQIIISTYNATFTVESGNAEIEAEYQ